MVKPVFVFVQSAASPQTLSAELCTPGSWLTRSIRAYKYCPRTPRLRDEFRSSRTVSRLLPLKPASTLRRLRRLCRNVPAHETAAPRASPELQPARLRSGCAIHHAVHEIP